MTLEQYRDDLSESYGEEPYDGLEQESFIQGFDAAIALELHVKFAEWKDEESSVKYDVIPREYLFEGKRWKLKELYQYWLDNVFKIES